MKKCSLCGEKALEGIEICPECLKRAAVAPKQIKRVRQISNILSGRYRHEYKSLYAEHNRNCGRFGKGQLWRRREETGK